MPQDTPRVRSHALDLTLSSEYPDAIAGMASCSMPIIHNLRTKIHAICLCSGRSWAVLAGVAEAP